jgi:PPOX class probable F420-dependent enzyme
METEQALQAARDTHQSILVTLKSDGKPQLSNVLHIVGDDGVIRISIHTGRAKYKNLQRTPWAALHVNGPTFWGYAVLEGDVTLSEPAAAPDDATVQELVDLYRGISGEHDDWDDYRAAQVSEHRLVVRLTPTRAYGMLR